MEKIGGITDSKEKPLLIFNQCYKKWFFMSLEGI